MKRYTILRDWAEYARQAAELRRLRAFERLVQAREGAQVSASYRAATRIWYFTLFCLLGTFLLGVLSGRIIERLSHST